jgi:predicted house-cleaning NTP pyrophosphatase (Maf/HAM1 superfamily)
MISIVLASRSPNRIAILRREAVAFEAISAPMDDAAQAPSGIVEQNAMDIARLKARSVVHAFAQRCEGKIILAADTMCEMAGRAMGKPQSVHEARSMLELAFTGAHTVVTGVCLLHRGKEWTFFDQALVTIDAVSPDIWRVNCGAVERVGMTSRNDCAMGGGYIAKVIPTRWPDFRGCG